MNNEALPRNIVLRNAATKQIVARSMLGKNAKFISTEDIPACTILTVEEITVDEDECP